MSALPPQLDWSPLEELVEQSYAVLDELIPPELCRKLAEDLRLRYSMGQFMSAGVGQGADQQNSQSIRSDEIKWLDALDASPAAQQWQSLIKELIEWVNENFYLAINSAEFHFACYEVGHFYQKHLDTFRHDNGRRLSLVLFLNEHWAAEDGGQLLIYHPNQQDQLLASIQPKFSRLVIFRSELMPHEVLPARAQRLTLTGWLKH